MKSKSLDAVIICQKMQEGSNDRIHTLGGVNIEVKIGEYVQLEYVGAGFDVVEVCTGEALHEAWKIPWDDILFIEGKKANRNQYRIYRQDNKQEYLQQIERRKKFLKQANPEKGEEIELTVPMEYQEMPDFLFQNMIDDVILPLFMQSQELQKNRISHFIVEINCLKDGKLVPYELNDSIGRIKKDDKER